MRIFSDFSEFRAAVGTEIGASEWVEITQDRINRFADATCDEQWIHIDQDRAQKELPSGKTIAHGLLSLSLAPMFIRSVMGLSGLRNTLNYGADRIRYLSPVPAGSRIRGRISIAEVEDVPPDGLRVNYHLAIEIEGGAPRLRRGTDRAPLSLTCRPNENGPANTAKATIAVYAPHQTYALEHSARLVRRSKSCLARNARQ